MREAREVEYAAEIQRVISVDMDMEQRLTVIVEDLMIELVVLLVGALGRVLQPERMDVVYRLRLGLVLRLFVLVVFLLLLLGLYNVEVDLDRHERAVLVENLTYAVLFEELVLVLHDVHDDVGAALGAVVVLRYLIIARLGAHPLDRAVRLPRSGYHVDGVADHKGGIESETEVTDDAVLRRVGLAVLSLVLLDEVERAGERYLADVLSDLFLGHADAVIRDGEGARRLVDRYGYPVLLVLEPLDLAEGGKTLQLRDSVTGVRDYLAEENLLLRVQPLLDYREYMLDLDGNSAFFGVLCFF